MSKKWSLVAIVAVLAALVVTSCKPATVTVTVEVPKEVVVTPTPLPPKEFKSKDPTTYVVATFGEPETLDPALAYETAGGEILQNVYEGLIFYKKDSAMEFIPQLATDWKISDDGKTYTFTIRQGVKFHEGGDLTPEDVAYSFQRGLLQGGTHSPQWLLTEPFFGVGVDDIAVVVEVAQALGLEAIQDGISEEELAAAPGELYDDTEAMQAVDPAILKGVCEAVKSRIVADNAAGTVTFQLAQPWGPFLATIAQTWGSIMDKEWVVEKGGWDGSCETWAKYYGMASENDPFTPIANGTGPFKLDHWTPGQEIVLVRNDNYWRTEPAWEGGPSGPAKLARVVIKKVDEWGTRFAMFQAGDADWVAVNRQDVSQVDPLVGEKCVWNNEKGAFEPCEVVGDGPFRLYIGFPTVSRTDVFLNFNINVPEGGNPFVGSGKLDGNGIPPDFFSDPHIRKAFNYCFDWDTFIQDALVGEGIQSTGIAIPGMIGYDPNGPHYTFDLEKCTEEFKLADVDKDGKPAGEDEDDVWNVGFRMQVAYNTGNVVRQTVAEILASNLAQVNGKFQVEIVGLPWPTFLRNQRAKTLPLFISGWLEDIHDPHNWYVPYLIGTYGRRQSLPEDAVAEFKALINRGVMETDPAKRHAIYQELNQKVYDLAPQIILAVATGRRYEQRWMEGWYYNPIYPGQYFYVLSKK